jgi:hypothetical protein
VKVVVCGVTVVAAHVQGHSSSLVGTVQSMR